MPSIVRPTEYEVDPIPSMSQFDTSKKRSKAIKKYRSRVTAAKRYRENEGYDSTWERLRDTYRLRTRVPGSFRDNVAVNIAFATINVIGPSVAVNRPKTTVMPKFPGQEDNAAIAEAVVNYWWEVNDIKPSFRRAVKDSLIYGHGWVKVGWHYEEREREWAEGEREQERDALEAELHQAAGEDPANAHLLPSTDDVDALFPDRTSEVYKDGPYAERISPFDVFVDPEATSLEDAKWIAQRMVVPLEDVKKDERYKPRIRAKLKADGSLKWFNEDSKADIPPDEGRVTLWEYYDLAEDHVCVFAEGQQGEDFLVEPRPTPYPYGQPFVFIPNYEVPDQFYPIGEIEAIEDLVDELNHTRSAMVQVRKQDIAKWVYREDAFGPNALDALTSDQPNAMAPVQGDFPLSDVVQPVARNDANAQLFMEHSRVIEDDIDRTTGVNEYMRGALPEIRRTATEASIIQDAANARAADKLDRIEGIAADISKRLIMLAQTFMTSEQLARRVGSDGRILAFEFDAEAIKGEFDFQVEAGSTQPQNETFRRQQAQQLMQVMGPLIGSGFVNIPALLAHVLRDGFGIKNPEKFVQDPMMGMGMPGMPGGPEQGGAPTDQPMPPEQEEDPQMSGGIQPPSGPGANPPSPDDTIQGIPEGFMNQLRGQIGLGL